MRHAELLDLRNELIVSTEPKTEAGEAQGEHGGWTEGRQQRCSGDFPYERPAIL
jgi:hypothetical protein